MTKYLFETEEPIKDCRACPFGDEFQGLITCMHPQTHKTKAPSEATMEYETCTKKPEWCPLKEVHVVCSTARLTVPKSDLERVLNSAEFERYIEQSLAQELAQELRISTPTLSRESDLSDNVIYEKILKTFKEIPHG